MWVTIAFMRELFENYMRDDLLPSTLAILIVFSSGKYCIASPGDNIFYYTYRLRV